MGRNVKTTSKYKAIKVDGVKHDYHRWRMEQELGRKLSRNEIVHHKNGNPLDNDISNLEVMSLSEHSRMHKKEIGTSKEALEKISIANMGNLNGHPRKLTPEQVRYIKAHYIAGDPEYGARALGRKFNIAHSKISGIINGKTYRDIV